MAVFQPHRYTRLSHLMNAFATSFNQADVVIVTEVYAAGERPLPGVSGSVLFEEIVQFGHKQAFFEPDLAKVPWLVGKLARPNDIVLVLGAGNITRMIPAIIAGLEGGK